MKTVLITGGGGFMGSHLVDSQLAQGNRVRAVDLHVERLAGPVRHPTLEVVAGDITNEGLIRQVVQGVDLVYHLASAHLDVRLAAEDYRRVNVTATVNLLQAARAAGVQRLVHCSSNGVLGEIEQPPANEETVCRPTNIYEQTKLEGEQAALHFCRQTGFPVVVVRPGWVYGPRCPRTRKLIRTIGQRRFVMFGAGQTLRHPVYVADAIRGLELAAQANGVAGQVYFIAGETPVTIGELVALTAELQGVKPPGLHLPVSLGKAVGYAVQAACKPIGRQPPFSRRSVDFFLKDNAYDISKAKRELGFQPHTDLRTGLTKTLAWLNNGNTLNS